MKMITRFKTLFLITLLALFTGCMPDSLTKFEENEANTVTTNDGGTSPTIPGAGTGSCEGTPAECFGPSDIRYDDQNFDLDNPGSGSSFTPTIIGNEVPLEQLNFSLRSALPAGLGFKNDTGEFFGTPVDYFDGTIEVLITHPTTGKTFFRDFNLTVSRKITKIEFHIPVAQKVILTLTDEESLTKFNDTQNIVTENGTKMSIDYIDETTKEIFCTVTKTGPININDKIDNNAFFVIEKAVIQTAVLTIDLSSVAAEVILPISISPDLSAMTAAEKATIMTFTTDPTDKILDTDPNGVQDQFFICDDPNDARCAGSDFGALHIDQDQQQAEKSILIKMTTVEDVDLNNIITYRVLPFSSAKSIEKVVYEQKTDQRLIIELPGEDDAEKFTSGGFISNDRGAIATIDFVGTQELYVRMHADSASKSYFDTGDKIDNQKVFFFEEVLLDDTEENPPIVYVYPKGTTKADVGSNIGLHLEPLFFFPDGTTELFDTTSVEENQVRVKISPNPTDNDTSITYANTGNLDTNQKAFSFCDTNDNQIFDGADSTTTTKSACLTATNDWYTAGTLAINTGEITSTLNKQIFQAEVENANGEKHNFIFKLSFDSPPKEISINKYVLIPVNKTTNFEVGDYISSSAPPNSNDDCRSPELSLSLRNFGGTFTGLTGAQSIIDNEAFWNCAVGVVTDIYDSTRNMHEDASSQKYISVKVTKGRFQNGMSLDNVRVFSSEKSKISAAPMAFTGTFVMSAVGDGGDASKGNINHALDTDFPLKDNIFDRYLIMRSQAGTEAKAQAIAAFTIKDAAGVGLDYYKVLVRITPDHSSCNAASISVGSCRFEIDEQFEFIDPITGLDVNEVSGVANGLTLEFIVGESVLFTSESNGDLNIGNEITAEPFPASIIEAYTYEDLFIKPLNAVVLDSPDPDTSNLYEVFVRDGTFTRSATSKIANTNPFSGSKYYSSAGEGASDDAADSPFGTTDDARKEIQIDDSDNRIYSSNIFYLYKDDPFSISTYVTDSQTTLFSITPELPEGVFLDENTGEIRGAAAGKSDPRLYTMTATNPFGSTKSYFKIEVLEYFGIELFAQNNEPFSYLLHKEGQSNELTKCRVLKKQIDFVNNLPTFNQAKLHKKVIDIGCWLDAGERDLFEKGIDLALRIPNNTCEYVRHEPYQFFPFKPGTSSHTIYNNVSGEKGIFEDSTSANYNLFKLVSEDTASGNKNNNLFINQDPDAVAANYTVGSAACNTAATINDITGLAVYPNTSGTHKYPGILKASGDPQDPDNPTNTIQSFELLNGSPITNIFGHDQLEKKSDATKFLCSYNYTQEDPNAPQGPSCDEGKINILTATWNVGGGFCDTAQFGRIQIKENVNFHSRVVDNSGGGPCRTFTLQNGGLSCIADAEGATDLQKSTCAALTTPVACVANADCAITDGQEGNVLKGAGSTDQTFCHVPVFMTVDIADEPEEQSCGGEHKNCASGPATELASFSAVTGTQHADEIITVSKVNGVDSLDGRNFIYAPARNALLGNGDEASSVLKKTLDSNLYLANFIGHPDRRTLPSKGSHTMGPMCAFDHPTQDPRNQSYQYDIDTLVRGNGFRAAGNPNAGYGGITASLIQSPGDGSRPYYAYKCLDSADNVVARIRLIVRDWNKAFRPSNNISFVNPDIGNTRCPSSGPDNFLVGTGAGNALTLDTDVECSDLKAKELTLMDNSEQDIFDVGSYNDKLDWDDFGFTDMGVAPAPSCYNMNYQNAVVDSKIKGDQQVCYGQCTLNSEGDCFGAGGLTCTERTAAQCLAFNCNSTVPGNVINCNAHDTQGKCLEDTANSCYAENSGCMLTNFPAFGL